MTLQGDYDPNTFVSGLWGTYPAPTSDPWYQPGMFWSFSVGGTFDGTPVNAGDRCYVLGRARQVGDAAVGDYLVGNPPDRDWPVEVTTFDLWFANDSPWLQDPTYAEGCPLIGAWRVIVQFLRDDRVADDSFEWADLTQHVAEITITRGGDDAAPVVPVSECRLLVLDPEAHLFPMIPRASSKRFTVGDRVRVGLHDGTKYHPLFTGRIGELTDEHDDEKPRVVDIGVYGHVLDLQQALTGVQRPEESAVARLEAIEASIEWTWADFDYSITPGPILFADPFPTDVEARTLLDRTAISGGLAMYESPRGVIEFVGPLAPTGVTHGVTDRTDDPSRLPSPSIVYASDLDQTLNAATVTNRPPGQASTGTTHTYADAQSIARFGRRERAHGFPLADLTTRDAAPLAAVADQYGATFARVVQRVDSVDGDTRLDVAWLTTFATLAIGDTVNARREGVLSLPTDFESRVVGFELDIIPGAREARGFIEGRIRLAGLTQSELAPRRLVTPTASGNRPLVTPSGDQLTTPD